jgi:hypothetical protein
MLWLKAVDFISWEPRCLGREKRGDVGKYKWAIVLVILFED